MASGHISRLKHIAVLGTGAVGGYFGGKIAYKLGPASPDGRKVFFVTLGPHLERIRRDGLILNTLARRGMVCTPTLATDVIEELPCLDLCFIGVKSYDLDEVLQKAHDKIGDDTIIIPLLNGVDICERIRRHVARGVVLPACVHVSACVEAPGVVTQIGGEGAIVGEKDPDGRASDMEPVKRLLDETGIAVEWREDAYPAIWQKYIFVAAFGLVTAHAGKTLGQVMADRALRETLRRVATEIVTIARKQGVELPDTIVEESLQLANNYPFEQTTSYHRDVEARGKNEGDLFGGTILRYARALGVPVSATQAIYTKIQRRLGA